MRLRERELLKPPRRYGEEEICIAPSRQTGASASTDTTTETPPRSRIMPSVARPSVEPPPYIDYDPNLPPAAFPTISQPRQASNTSQRQKGEPQQSSVKYKYENGYSTGVRTVGSSSGATETDSEQYVDVEDYKDLRPCLDVDWKDIGPILQTEIVRNLERVYTSSRVASLLQLSVNEQEIVFGYSESRNAQLKTENEKLNEMREKQLRALLRIDNSTLKQSRVPDQLVFRNISKQYIRDRKARPDPDFFMVQASELLAARRYLRNIGLDPRFAGEWKNDLAVIQRPRHDNEDEDFRWTLDSYEPVEQDTLARLGQQSAGSSPQNSPLKANNLSPQIRFINQFGDPNGAACEIPVYSKTDRFPTTPLNAAQHILGRRQSLQKRDRDSNSGGRSRVSKSDGTVVRLKVGPEGAAQIHNLSAHFPSLPSSPPSVAQQLNSSLQLPPQLALADDSPTKHFLNPDRLGARKRRHPTSTLPGLGSSSPLYQDDDLPVSRILSGAWWYGSGAPENQSPENNSSKSLTERLLAVKAESELKHSNSSPCSLEPETPKRRPLDLPFRSSPTDQLSQNRPNCVNDRLLDAPMIGQKDLLSSTFTTPTKQSDTHVGSDVSAIKCYQSNMSGNLESEDEHGPEYSPITPRPAVGFSGEPVKNKAEQGQDTDPMDVNTSYPTDKGEASVEFGGTIQKRESSFSQAAQSVTLSEIKEENCLEQSHNPLVNTNCETTQENPLNSLTDSLKVQNNDDQDQHDNDVDVDDIVDENQKDIQDISPFQPSSHTLSNMENETAPCKEEKYEKSQSDKKATTKKTTALIKRRRSARLNPRERVLRPRPGLRD